MTFSNAWWFRARVALLAAIAVGASALLVSGAGEPSSASQAKDESLAALRREIRLGAEFFLNRSETQQTVRDHFRRMREHGLSVVRIFVIWDDLERQPNVWTFDRYDWVYDAAAENKMIVLTTLCAEDPPGWMHLTPFYHAKLTLNTPYLRQRAATYIEKVVDRYKNHPAQGPWLLANEPLLFEAFDKPAAVQFGQWLKAKYATIEELNRHWFRPQPSFEEIEATRLPHVSWCDYPSYVDWQQFRIWQLCDQLEWTRGEVWKHDTQHLTHANPSGLLGCPPGLWEVSRRVDFLGGSVHPSWQFGEYRRGDYAVANAFSVDLLRSAAGKKPVWVTEMQAGPTVFCANQTMSPTPQELTRWLWDDIGAGARGMVFWLWHPRDVGREAGEFALVDGDGRPTPRSKAVQQVAADVQRLDWLLSDARPLPAPAAILYNPDAMILYGVDGAAALRNGGKSEITQSLIGCHRSLLEGHVAADFIVPDDLRNGTVNRYRVLYLPYCYVLDHQAAQGLRRFVEQGGTVVADGLLAWKDPVGHTCTRIPGELADVFGVEVEDIEPLAEAATLTGGEETAAELWRMHLRLCGADVLLRSKQDEAVATRHRFGKGEAYYFGTALWLGYHRHPSPLVAQWVTGIAEKARQASPVCVTSGSDRVICRGMQTPQGLLAVLSNAGPKTQVTVSFDGRSASVTDVLSGRAAAVELRQQRTCATIEVPEQGVCVLSASSVGSSR